MIDSLDKALEKMLETEIKVAGVQVSFDAPKHEWSQKATNTVNLYLYDVRENTTLRQSGWEYEKNKDDNGPNAQLHRPPLRIDCFYMLTTWDTSPQKEHKLLAEAMRVLFLHPTLPDEYLDTVLKKQPFVIPTKLGVNDRLTNPAEVWNVLDNEMRPSVPYIVTLAVTPWPEPEPVKRVQEDGRHLYAYQMESLGEIPKDAPADFHPSFITTNEHAVDISGLVRDTANGNQPLVKARVTIAGTRRSVTTGNDGKFAFDGLAPTRYKLLVQPDQGAEKSKMITVSKEKHEFVIDL